MNNINSASEDIFHQVYNYYIESSDYNGIAIQNLKYDKINLVDVLIDLIENDKIAILNNTFDENPHIIRFGFPTKEKQIEYLSNHNKIGEVCAYPTSSYLKTNRDVTEFDLSPFDKMMALGYPQCKACYFEYDVLMHYAFDPRMNFNFNDYYGSINSIEQVDDNRNIQLETFGIGRNNNSFVVVSYPRYLKRMSTMNQFIWIGHIINDATNCKTLINYIDNQFRECWAFPNTVYRAILKEIYNINQLTEVAFGKTLFHRVFTKQELYGFDMLSFPSLYCYNDFLLLLEKVIISNIDGKFFNSMIEPLDDKGRYKGSLVCLKEWISHIRKDVCEEIYDPLHQVRIDRQKPAHSIQDNKYSNEYLSKQYDLTNGVYASLNLLRRLLQSHPKVSDLDIKYPNTKYITI
jgi:hypothetical protein